MHQQVEQVFRDPSLTAEGVYHDRLTEIITQPEILRLRERERRADEARYMRIFRTATEFFGKNRAVEVTYEHDPANRGICINSVTLVRKICGKGEYWYDNIGQFHEGPHFERTEVSGQLDREQLQALGEEVIGQSMTYRRRGG